MELFCKSNPCRSVTLIKLRVILHGATGLNALPLLRDAMAELNAVFSDMFSLISWNECTSGIGEGVLEDDGEFVGQQNLWLPSLPVFIVSSLLCFIICSLERFKSKVMTAFQEMEYTVLQKKIASIKSPPRRFSPWRIALSIIGPRRDWPLEDFPGE